MLPGRLVSPFGCLGRAAHLLGDLFGGEAGELQFKSGALDVGEGGTSFLDLVGKFLLLQMHNGQVAVRWHADIQGNATPSLAIAQGIDSVVASHLLKDRFEVGNLAEAKTMLP